jgi:hypothetical protein
MYRAIVIGSLLSGLALLGCDGDGSGPAAPLDASHTFWALQVNYHGVNMATAAPYNTLQLHTVALNINGDSLSGWGDPIYSTSDSAVSVSPTGLVTAHFATVRKPTMVFVTKQYQGVTLWDTVMIAVTDTIPQHPLATFKFEMPGGVPSASLDASSVPVTIRATTTTGDTMCDSVACPLALHYTSANPAVAQTSYRKDQFSTNSLSLSNPGRTFLTASTWYYGTVQSDTLTFTVTRHASAYVDVQTLNNRVHFQTAPILVLDVGSVVSFGCFADDHCTTPIDIVFDDPLVADTASARFVGGGIVVGPPTGTGNIEAFGGDSISPVGFALAFRARRFSRPGKYHYHSTVLPSDTNTILIVQDAP